jgi:hypothetical protein
MKVAVLIPFVSDYMRNEDGDPLYFDSVKEALTYLVNRNFTAPDLIKFDYEEVEEC